VDRTEELLLKYSVGAKRKLANSIELIPDGAIHLDVYIDGRTCSPRQTHIPRYFRFINGEDVYNEPMHALDMLKEAILTGGTIKLDDKEYDYEFY